MASKTTLNTKNLEALGAKRLAELLIEISSGDAAAKRRLRLELAGTGSPEDVAKQIRKRLMTISCSCSYVDWQKRRALVKDLETQRRAIAEKVAKHDPAEALELMWRFLGLANSVFERCDDSSGTVVAVFDKAVGDLGEIASAAQPDPKKLAEDVFRRLCQTNQRRSAPLALSLHLPGNMINVAWLKAKRSATRPADQPHFEGSRPSLSDKAVRNDRAGRLARTTKSRAVRDPRQPIRPPTTQTGGP